MHRLYIGADTNYKTMKTIKIRMDTKKRLDSFGEGLSNNKAMRKLLEDVNTVEMVVCKKEFSNIHMDDDLFDKLKKCKKYSSESHSDVIDRLLSDKGY